jgi:lipopolysaccharide export system permease protein
VNTFDRHLLREWLAVIGLVLVLMCGLLLVQVMYDDFRELREAGARGWDLWRYVFVTMPSNLAVALPLVLLVSTLYVLGKLHRANELTAMRAAGVGFGRLMRPVWVVGVLACGLSWWLNTAVVPWSVEESRTLRDTIFFRKQAQVLPPDRIGAVFSVGFDDPDSRRMWFFNRYSQLPPARGYGVSVTQMDAHRHEVSRVVASEARFDPVQGDWTFPRGRESSFDPDTGVQLSSVPFASRRFAQFHEDPRLMLLIDRRPIDLSLAELKRLVDYYALEENPKGVPYAVRYFGLIADTLAPLIVIAMAIPFAITGVRVNPAVGVSKSIGLFFLYYLLANLAVTVATKQLVEPALAAWLPNLGMAALAVWFFARLR